MKFRALILCVFLLYSFNLIAIKKDTTNLIFNNNYVVNFDTTFNYIDTSLLGFNLYSYYYTNKIGSANLGNEGLPFLSFSDIPNLQNSDFIFLDRFKNYYLDYDVSYINKTNARFTNFTFYNNGSKSKSQNILKVFHTQNLSPYLNITFNYNVVNSLGIYKNQLSKNNFLNTHYSYNKDRISSYASFNLNKMAFKNNGGIIDNSYAIDSSFEAPLIPVNLENSSSILSNLSLKVNNKLNFGNWVDTTLNDTTNLKALKVKSYIEHEIILSRSYFKYYDMPSTYFSNYYYSDSATFDSTSHYSMSNKIGFSNLKNTKSNNRFYFGLENTINHYHFFNWDTTYLDYHLLGFFTKNIADFNFNIYTRYTFLGFNSGDFIGKVKVKRKMKSSVVCFNFEQNIYSPNYNFHKIFTNNYLWTNFMQRVKVSNFGVGLNIDSLMFNVKLNYLLIDNYVYFDNDFNVNQYTKIAGIVKLNLYKQLNYKKLSFIHHSIIQYSAESLPFDVPLFSTYNSLMYNQIIIKNVLNSQFGIDVFYNTEYNSYIYNPALIAFSKVNEQVGNYPYVDVFVNLKLKRVRFMLKYIHANMGLQGNNYIAMPNYPLPEHSIRFGISWNFYD